MMHGRFCTEFNSLVETQCVEQIKANRKCSPVSNKNSNTKLKSINDVNMIYHT